MSSSSSSSMSFSVSKKAPALVAPSAATPSGRLPLSAEDRVVPLFFFVHGIVVFEEGGTERVSVVREALAKALVPYYPVAGRIVADPDDDGELGIACTGEGVWFVEASADCSLESLGDVNLYFQQEELEQPQLLDLVKHKLLPSLPAELDQTTVPLMMQVTEFLCGGFMLGFKFSHAMFDGVGMGQFVVAMGEMARGLAEPTTKPVWCRNALPRLTPGPSEADTDHPPVAVDSSQSRVLLPYTVDIPIDRVDKLKDRFEEETGERCTAFDVVAAKLWQCRTRAMGLQPHVAVSVHFLANIRRLLRDRLPPEGGYYGNCLNFVVVEGQAGHIAGSPIFEIVRLVKEAKERLPTQLSRWLKGLAGQPVPSWSSTSLSIVDWRRLGLYETDFGCGAAKYVASFDEPPVMLLNSPAPAKGIRVVTKCVAEEHLDAFRNNMSEW
ncbi:putative taxadien-5-alpha-ol O-acetyltransferase [Iris pallida]|uniref:Taxadien-5-alpha-ol O-acetyltransferase n=1 Tax=Iris pallida TaxID=29817 RepID=A0AAX6DI06_IRIPA|nr:putative taxadien-5-alpha-ol O-acetyltransferase [Iris pallida]